MLKRYNYAGKYLGGYRLITEIASSDRSRVFLGESVSPTKQMVAIKRLINTRIDLRQEQESFLQEVRFLKQLQHPNILPLLDANIDKGIPYIVTAYAPNGSLQNRLERQFPLPLPQNEVAAIVSQVGRALYYAHERNVIHCNLKPQNILFDSLGNVQVADFTFASLTTSLNTLTSATPDATVYMAPELFDGKISKEGDQFSLACIVYEMLTGRKPFIVPSLRKPGTYHRTNTLIPLSKLNPTVPRSVEQAVTKALSEKPSQRYRDIGAFLKALGVPISISIKDTARRIITPPPKDSVERSPVGLARVDLRQARQPQFIVPTTPVARQWATPPAGNASVLQKPLSFHRLLTLFMDRKAWAANARSTVSALKSVNAKKATLAATRNIENMIRQTWRSKRALLLAALSVLLITGIVGAAFLAFRPGQQQNAQVPGSGPQPTMQTTAPANGGQQGNNPGGPAVSPTPKATATSIVVAPQPKPVTTPTPSPLPRATMTPRVPQGPPKGTLIVTTTYYDTFNCAISNTTYICKQRLRLSANSQSRQNWYAYSNDVSAVFQPSAGTIGPGEVITVTMYIFDDCPQTGTLAFVGARNNVKATWSC